MTKRRFSEESRLPQKKFRKTWRHTNEPMKQTFGAEILRFSAEFLENRKKLPTPDKASKLTDWRELSFLEWIIITFYPSLGMIPLAKQQAWYYRLKAQQY